MRAKKYMRQPKVVCEKVCPVCNGRLVDIKQKLICEKCKTIVETCCEGGRG